MWWAELKKESLMNKLLVAINTINTNSCMLIM